MQYCVNGCFLVGCTSWGKTQDSGVSTVIYTNRCNVTITSDNDYFYHWILQVKLATKAIIVTIKFFVAGFWGNHGKAVGSYQSAKSFYDIILIKVQFMEVVCKYGCIFKGRIFSVCCLPFWYSLCLLWQCGAHLFNRMIE